MRVQCIDTAQTPSTLAHGVLQEIAERLAALVGTGESAAIDLRSLPMTNADRDELERRLGRGEVVATLALGGTSELWEPRYCGVWWVRHFGTGGQIAAERIEIAAVPPMLVAQQADIAAAAARVQADVRRNASTTDRETGAHG